MKRNALVAISLIALLPLQAQAAQRAKRPCKVMNDQQVGEEVEALFKRVDVNKDGKITKVEMMGVASQHRGAVTVVDKRWKIGDKDGDGKLSRDEGRDMVRYISELCSKSMSKK